MSKYVVEIPGREQPGSIWEQRLRVAAYCRVSTAREEQQSSLKNQIEYYTEYIRENLYWQFVAVYYDTGSGLRTGNRPGYRQMLKDCGKRKIDLILVKTLSRFGRDTVETIKQIRRLRQMNIGVYIETIIISFSALRQTHNIPAFPPNSQGKIVYKRIIFCLSRSGLPPGNAFGGHRACPVYRQMRCLPLPNGRVFLSALMTTF